MSVKVIEKSVLSSDRIHELKGVIYLPQGTPKAFLHVVHGMTEHIGRYDRFMTDMAKAGYICFGFDTSFGAFRAKGLSLYPRSPRTK